jgi:hypothetical protein
MQSSYNSHHWYKTKIKFTRQHCSTAMNQQSTRSFDGKWWHSRMPARSPNPEDANLDWIIQNTKCNPVQCRQQQNTTEQQNEQCAYSFFIAAASSGFRGNQQVKPLEMKSPIDWCGGGMVAMCVEGARRDDSGRREFSWWYTPDNIIKTFYDGFTYSKIIEDIHISLYHDRKERSYFAHKKNILKILYLSFSLISPPQIVTRTR